MASNKLTAKAAKLDFSALPGAPAPANIGTAAAPNSAAAAVAVAVAASHASAPTETTFRPKTAPGAMMAFANDARSEMMRENESLRAKAGQTELLQGQLNDALVDLAQWEGAKAARLIDPKRVSASKFANRHDLNYAGAEFAALRAEIESAGGNVQAIKVRQVGAAGPEEARYEVVFGHRRHRACLELGLPVLAVVDNLDDRTLFVEMDRENRSRQDLSAWEQGTMYRRALQQGLFPSNRKLADAVGVDLSALGKALSLAELPEPLVRAFASPLALQFRWAKPLGQALTANRDAVLACAQALASGPSDRKAKAVFERLLAAAGGGVEPFHPPVPISLAMDGTVAGAITQGANGEVVVSIAAGHLPTKRLPALAKLMEGFLRAESRSKA